VDIRGFFSRVSAQLSLYPDVRKRNIEFLSEPLNRLPSHFRIARMSWLFLISITGLSFAALLWV
jgi:putative photosynthetic complex assembly protein 2